MTIRLFALPALLVPVLACGSPPAPASPGAAENAVASARPAASSAAPATSTAPPAPSSSDQPAAPSSATAGTGVPDWTPAADGVDGWLQSKGIQDTSSASLIKLAGLPDSVRVECDKVVPVGKPVGEAALCRRQYKEGMWVLATSFLLLVPDQGHLRKVWEMPSAAGQLSRRDLAESPLVQLNLSMQDDGMLLFLDEAEGLGCGDWRARLDAARKDSDPEDKDTFASLARLAGRVCQGKGRYAWRGTSFGR